MARKILIVGSGIVGEATGTGFAEQGFEVTYADTNAGVVDRLRQKGYRAFEISQLPAPDTDMYMISVPTYPLDLCKDEAAAEKLEHAMSALEWCDIGVDFIKSASATIGRWIGVASRYQVVVIRSAVLPGTTEEIIIPRIEMYSGKKAGNDFGVSVNPEYLREVSSIEDIRKPWVVVIGELDSKSGDMVEELYGWAECPHYRLSLKEAEMQKFVHNLCNANKISFFNDMRLICKRVGVDGDKIMPIVARSAEALWNPEYGTKDYGPFGGKCLPKDSVAFLAWVKKSGMESIMMDAVLRVNEIYEKRLKAVGAA